MRIGIQTWGSEGDIRPFVALGARPGAARPRRRAGLHRDRRTALRSASPRRSGFTARAVATPVVADSASVYEIGLRSINARNPLTQGQIIVERLASTRSIEPIYEAAVDLCRAIATLIVGHFILHPARAAAEHGRHAADQRHVRAHADAVAVRSIRTGTPRLGEWGNALEWKHRALRAESRRCCTDVNRFRARVGLPPIDDLMRDGWAVASPEPARRRARRFSSGAARLAGVEPASADSSRCRRHDARSDLAGARGIPRRRPAAGVHGLRQPDADRRSSHLTETMAMLRRGGATRRLPRDHPGRASPSTVAAQRSRIMFVSRTPHTLGLPSLRGRRASLRRGHHAHDAAAGVPSIPVPHVSDQFAWADELHRLGVAPPRMPRRSLDGDEAGARGSREVAGQPAHARTRRWP